MLQTEELCKSKQGLVESEQCTELFIYSNWLYVDMARY